ncbi:MAG: lamin tail domain-containing protein [Planctomycetes bacterium]|nr:lamin tail domain-containing protein [Planctomycetota bacterium]
MPKLNRVLLSSPVLMVIAVLASVPCLSWSNGAHAQNVHASDRPSTCTVGNTTVFEEEYAPENRRAVPFRMPEEGVIHSVTMFHDGGSTGDIILAVYDDDGGSPGSRLAVTEETPADLLPGWQTIGLITPVHVDSGARIWLAWVYEDMPGVRVAPSEPGWGRAKTVPARTWSDIPKMPDEFGSSDVSADWTYSIYATYAPAGGTPDEDPPQPDPPTWASPPSAISHSAITMTATKATDPSAVQYYFEETSGNSGGSSSGWQTDNTYTDYGLSPKTQYTYRLKTRDRSPFRNEGNWSTSESATTSELEICPRGDISENCRIDSEDLRLFADQWLDSPGETANLDDAEGVDFADYAILAENWRKEGRILVINEFMASNSETIADPQGEYNDWIEIFNASNLTIDLGGMWLADDRNWWQIPTDRPHETTVYPYGYLLIWADEDDRDEPGLHASFKLDAGGDQISLYAADGVTPIDSIDFEDLGRDVSHGRFPDASDDWFDMDKDHTTPLSSNLLGMPGAPYFSHPGGTFTGSLELGLTTKLPTADIYYTLDGSEPDNTKTRYVGLVTISKTTWVRARVYESGRTAGAIVSKVYIKLDADMNRFKSNLPIVLIDSFGLNIDGANRDFHPVVSVFIETNEATGRAVITDPADFAGYGGMHIRGASTAGSGYPKKQYRLETRDEYDRDRDVSILGFPPESDWILHAPYSDKTLMRNYQMYTWSRLIGRYAVRTRFVEVFIDDDGDGKIEWKDGSGSDTDYRGVYIFMEKIKRGSDRVDVAKLEPGDNSEPDITGGYILKKDWGGAGFTTSRYGDHLIYEDPRSEELVSAQKSWIKAHFNEFESALSGPGFDDPVNGYAKYIDVSSFIDHHILVEMAKNVDGFVLSTFLFKDRDGKINMGPIWDYNGSLGGADYFCNYDPTGWLHEFNERYCTDASGCGSEGEGGATFPADNANAYRWYQRLFDDPEFLLKYADRWFELREDFFTTDIVRADIDDNVAVLTDNSAPGNAVERNFMRWDIDRRVWPNLWDNCHTNTAYMDYVNWMKQWLGLRLDWMDGEIDDEYGAAPPVIRVNEAIQSTGGHISSADEISITGGPDTIYYTTDGNDPRRHGGATSPSAVTYAGLFTLHVSKQIKARIKDGSNWSALNEATFAVGPVAENLRITEIMYHPQNTGAPSDPNTEFIELKNIGTEPINLNLVSFTDGIDFVFPQVSLDPGGHVIVVQDLNAFTAEYGGGFNIAGVYSGRLDNGGERIELQDAVGQTILDFTFKDGWYHITDGHGFSLNIIDPANPDPNSWQYKEYWQASSAIKGTPCATDTGHFAPNGTIVINEVLTHTDNVLYGDWIELHNTTGSSVNIGGWFLSNDKENLAKYQIASDTWVPANGYRVFTATENFANLADPGTQVRFRLSELGETVYLSSGSGGNLAGGYCTKEDFKAAESEVTFGRYAKSAESGYDVDFVAMASATKASGNTTGARVGPVVISEIMYHPVSNGYAEYIELHNITDSNVPLYDLANPQNTWRLTDEDEDIEYYLPSGTWIPANGYLLLVKNRVAFASEFAPAGDVQIFEWVEGRLSNAGEKVQISKPGKPELDGFVSYIRLDRVNYSDGSHPQNFHTLPDDPWPAEPDGSGKSLTRVSFSAYGNDPANWQPASPTPGWAAPEE